MGCCFSNLLRKLLLLAALSGLVTCKSPHGSSLHEESCLPWSEIKSGSVLLTNNVWGAKVFPDYKQCIGIKRQTSQPEFSWNWHWRGRNDNVKAYPSLCFGHKPWNTESTSPQLPIKLNMLDSARVDYEIKTEAAGMYNILLESWLTSTQVPTPESRVGELAIHLQQHDWPGMPGKLIESIIIGGQVFDFYFEPHMHVPDDPGDWKYFGFVARGDKPGNTSRLHGQVDIARFIHFLIDRKLIDKSRYLSSVEIGNEVINGEGNTTIRRFVVSVQGEY